MRFTLKTLLVVMLVGALLIAWMQERGRRLELVRLAAAQLKVCDSLAKPKTALGVSAGALLSVDRNHAKIDGLLRPKLVYQPHLPTRTRTPP